MEEVKRFIIENWRTILDYALMFLAYFLVFLYRSKVKSTKTDLSCLFKERVQYIDNTDKKLREDIQDKLSIAESKYLDAVNKIESLEKDLARTKSALAAILEETSDE